MKLIHQLSKTTAIPIHTIRYYERFGLIQGQKNPNVSSNNYTWYDDEVVAKLILVKEAKEIGFTLSEIKELLDSWHSQQLTKEAKKKVLLGKVQQIEAHIEQLQRVKGMLIEGIQEVENGEC